MFNMNFSCRGDPGIGFDYEFSLRTWWKGYQVGLFKPDFVYHWGDWSKSGTRANRGLYRRRQTIEKRNSKYHLDMYGPRSGRDFYWRQGLPGRPTAFKTPREGLKGEGAPLPPNTLCSCAVSKYGSEATLRERVFRMVDVGFSDVSDA
jgi:hypothetical protein